MTYESIHILIVDDDEDDYLLIRDFFQDVEGISFDLDWVRTYEAALETVRSVQHDVYFLDYHLGRQTGMALLRELVGRGCPAPIFMLTAQGDRTLDLKAMEAGATDYLVKGRLNADLLERSVRYAIAQKQVEEALRQAHDELEMRVQARTAELVQTNTQLQQEIAERKRAEAALQEAHDDLEKRVQDRTIALSVINELLQLEVDQRKHSEQVLRESEARHRALLDAIPDAMITIGRDGTVREYKAPRDGVLPQTPGQFPEKPIAEVLPPRLAGLVMDYVEKVLQTGDRQVFDVQLPIQQEEHDIEARIVISGEDETLCILRDITERKNAERLKTEFLSIVSHELRTPLTSISGSLALMAAGVTGALPDQAEAMIQIAHRNSERLVRLINDLLDLQKIESGTMPLKQEPIEVLPLVEQVIEANYAYGSRYGVQFALEEEGDDLWVCADADRLMQVLTNLLSNAAKFSPAESIVTIAVTGRGEYVRISVADQGPGVPEAYQDLIFEKFAQVDASSSRQKEGTGLGLSISKAIIEMHGGRIAFDTAPGRGTTFYFDLPVWHEAYVDMNALRSQRKDTSGRGSASFSTRSRSAPPRRFDANTY